MHGQLHFFLSAWLQRSEGFNALLKDIQARWRCARCEIHINIWQVDVHKIQIFTLFTYREIAVRSTSQIGGSAYMALTHFKTQYEQTHANAHAHTHFFP